MSHHAPKSQAFQVDWEQLCRTAGPYPRQAYDFVREGLAYTVETMQPDGALGPEGRHVSGQQLCMGLRDFAILRYGMLAPVVLERWRIARTDDFGRIVFAMVDAGLMSKTPQDSIDDFRAVYDFAEAFAVEAIAARLRSASASRQTA